MTFNYMYMHISAHGIYPSSNPQHHPTLACPWYLSLKQSSASPNLGLPMVIIPQAILSITQPWLAHGIYPSSNPQHHPTLACPWYLSLKQSSASPNLGLPMVIIPQAILSITQPWLAHGIYPSSNPQHHPTLACPWYLSLKQSSASPNLGLPMVFIPQAILNITQPWLAHCIYPSSNPQHHPTLACPWYLSLKQSSTSPNLGLPIVFIPQAILNITQPWLAHCIYPSSNPQHHPTLACPLYLSLKQSSTSPNLGLPMVFIPQAILSITQPWLAHGIYPSSNPQHHLTLACPWHLSLKQSSASSNLGMPMVFIPQAILSIIQPWLAHGIYPSSNPQHHPTLACHAHKPVYAIFLDIKENP